MGVTINPQLILTAVETLDKGVDAATNPKVTHDQYNVTNLNLNATSMVPVSVVSYQDYVLVAGAKTIDLTALLGVQDEIQDATGLKLQSLIFINPQGNGVMTIGEGAANGYPLFGAGNDHEIPAHASVDGVFAQVFPEVLADVAAADKTIDVTGTGTQTFKLGITLG